MVDWQFVEVTGSDEVLLELGLLDPSPVTLLG